MRSRVLSNMLLGVAIVFCAPAFAADDEARRKPPTKVTEKISQDVFQQIESAQSALEAKNYAEGERILGTLLQSRGDKLNDYEKAQIYNFLAAFHYEQENFDATIQDYANILKLANPPEQLKTQALFRLAQIYFVKEEYGKSIKVLDKWMTVVESVSPEAHMLKAQALYQQEKYKSAERPIILALREAKKRGTAPRENWLALLRAVYYETGQYTKAIKTLEVLVQRWPKASYYSQLAGMHGLAKDQKKQLYVMHAAYVAGLLSSESDLLNMARLYMAEDAPSPAIEVLEKGIESGVVTQDAKNLQLLAQAMGLAKEYEKQIPVLKQAAALSGDAKQYMYLGQSQLALYDWAGASESLKKALAIGGLDSPGSVYMQLGTAYYNQKRYSPAKQAFKSAGQYKNYQKQSGQWVRFIDTEIKRAQALKKL